MFIGQAAKRLRGMFIIPRSLRFGKGSAACRQAEAARNPVRRFYSALPFLYQVLQMKGSTPTTMVSPSAIRPAGSAPS